MSQEDVIAGNNLHSNCIDVHLHSPQSRVHYTYKYITAGAYIITSQEKMQKDTEKILVTSHMKSQQKDEHV